MSETNGHVPPLPPKLTELFLRTFQGITTRLGLSNALGSTHDGLRDMDAVLGYKKTLTYADFKYAYERGGIAQRLITTYPKLTWGQSPLVRDTPDAGQDSAFAQAWITLDQRLGLTRWLGHIDALAQLGHYGCLLLGLRGQQTLVQPATPVRSADDLLFLQPYSEEFLVVETFGTDPGDPSYGKPVLYRLLEGGTTGGMSDRTLRRPTRAGVLVHASRVLHVPGERGLDDPEIYGLPLYEAIYNLLQNKEKVVGGSAEEIWRNRNRLAMELREGYAMSDETAAHLEQEALEYMHGWRDFLRTVGVDTKVLSNPVHSPTDHFQVIMQEIAGVTEIPWRFLVGSELGQLASSQDMQAMQANTTRRQLTYAEPRLLRKLLDQLILLRVLPEPQDRYEVEWPNVWRLSEADQAEIFLKRAQAFKATMDAITAYTGPGMAETLVTREEVRALAGPIWQSSELELSSEVPAEIEALLLAPAPTETPVDGQPPGSQGPAPQAPAQAA